MISLHSESCKAVSNAFTQAFVSLRRLIFDPLLGLYTFQKSSLLVTQREFWLSRRKLHAPRREFWLSRKTLVALQSESWLP